MRKLDEPLNAHERYLYGIEIRLDALCDMMSSFLKEYAKNNDIQTTSNQTEIINLEDVTVDIDYSSLTKAELVELLSENNIECNDRMLKADLLELTKLL